MELIELHRDIAQAGTDASNECVNLIRQALAATTTRDKDLLMERARIALELLNAS
jgi:hypothetical protein